MYHTVCFSDTVSYYYNAFQYFNIFKTVIIKIIYTIELGQAKKEATIFISATVLHEKYRCTGISTRKKLCQMFYINPCNHAIKIKYRHRHITDEDIL